MEPRPLKFPACYSKPTEFACRRVAPFLRVRPETTGPSPLADGLPDECRETCVVVWDSWRVLLEGRGPSGRPWPLRASLIWTPRVPIEKGVCNPCAMIFIQRPGGRPFSWDLSPIFAKLAEFRGC